jgi:hypothetical protein
MSEIFAVICNEMAKLKTTEEKLVLLTDIFIFTEDLRFQLGEEMIGELMQLSDEEIKGNKE